MSYQPHSKSVIKVSDVFLVLISYNTQVHCCSTEGFINICTVILSTNFDNSFSIFKGVWGGNVLLDIPTTSIQMFYPLSAYFKFNITLGIAS